ncbi:hypothetical protein EDC05_003508 [Coemansia umbellata]|uniref:Uncharacterized protein n=1 Tax=Coemansia umbellata TaxID=1424467 RepID=A0ABQ8PKV0_9FUNG|nr:hypothetical protein EDC05_003508 [Coemansia umbellata]
MTITCQGGVIFDFLQKNRDIDTIDFVDLPSSLSSPSELQKLNEGVLQLLPDLNQVSGRSLFIDKMMQQLDSSNPSTLHDMLMLSNIQSQLPSADPLLSSATTAGLYMSMGSGGTIPAPSHNYQHHAMGNAGDAGFDLTASPETSGAVTSMPLSSQMLLGAQSSTANIMSYPASSVLNVNNPTLADLTAGHPSAPATTSIPLADQSLFIDNSRASLSPMRVASLSPNVPCVPDSVLSARPIAQPKGYSGMAPMAPQPQLHSSGTSLYSNLYTPLQLQQAQQQQQQQQQAHLHMQQNTLAQATMGGMAYPAMQKHRVPMPSAQMVDPVAYQAQLNALMAYRAMGLQCKAREDEGSCASDDEDNSKELSLDEWLDAEKLTESEVSGMGASSAKETESLVVEQPEIEDTAENSDKAYSTTNSVVKKSILVQRSFVKHASVEGGAQDTNEPVSYLRRRSELLAKNNNISDANTKTQQEPAIIKDGDSDAATVDKKTETVNAAVQLLVRINTLYLRKVEEQRRAAAAAATAVGAAIADSCNEEEEGSSSEEEDEDEDSCYDGGELDDLERELSSMSLANEKPGLCTSNATTATEEQQQQDMIDRLTKLGLSSQAKGLHA